VLFKSLSLKDQLNPLFPPFFFRRGLPGPWGHIYLQSRGHHPGPVPPPLPGAPFPRPYKVLRAWPPPPASPGVLSFSGGGSVPVDVRGGGICPHERGQPASKRAPLLRSPGPKGA
jgi:hypothetical protein